MKIWSEFGTEHSSNLVMIGKFKTEEDAKNVEDFISHFTSIVQEASESNEIEIGESDGRFPKKILDFARNNSVLFTISAHELEQVLYDIRIERRGDTINVTTDEYDVSALMKIMFQKGARVEVYSAHDYPKTGLGRDTSGS